MGAAKAVLPSHARSNHADPEFSPNRPSYPVGSSWKWSPPCLAQAADAPGISQRDAELDNLLTEKARDIFERVKLVDGQRRSRRVEVVADIDKGIVTISLDRSFLPESHGPSYEDQTSEINFGLLHWAEQVAPFNRVIHLYDGKPAQDYFPEIKAADDAAREAGEAIRQQRARGSGMAFVSAGHGYFYSYKHKDWVTSRDEWNGVSEGLLTPDYADSLKTVIEQRSQMPVIRPRVQGMQTTHAPSGKKWWTLAARYAIAEQYPGEKHIWNTYANSTLWNREEREDINSRPFHANHLQADVAIHLHSNAAESQSVRGSRVIVQPGRPVDAELAQSVLCSMKELIHSVPGYSGFTVAPAPHAEDKGENRGAHMPSIIVETAFHTNPEDAAALLAPSFRAASMKGVEKGYRLWSQGKTCTPLAGKAISDVEVHSGKRVEVDIPLVGNPQYPIQIITTNTQCPPNWTCGKGKQVINSRDEPTRIGVSCGAGSSGTLGWETHVLDADGVASKPVPFSVRCVPD
ncbi:N-acetylmuramoyl-L-alanine amidase [Stenotrophomonas cyclobalanopsidis]|uniref:N-acetylmuramoyl-L-alanine amidase family protein n=1 Tax=Stenotrophomonas cyclobalanopsidis TaxID=2771362 RepID=UPI0034613A3A